jgi:peroxin-13
VLGEVLYDFVAEGEDELSITAGECIRIAPKQRQPRIRGWLLATVDGSSKGIVPANYIKVSNLHEKQRLRHLIRYGMYNFQKLSETASLR